MKLTDVYESSSKWLKSDDIKGQKPIVTIQNAEIKENTYDGETKKQIVLTFVGKDKQLGLNVTNAHRIADLLGTEEIEDWVGATIKLYVEKVSFGDKMVDAIRVMPDLPPQNGQQVQSPEEYTGPPNFPNGTPTDDSDAPEVIIPF